MIFKRKKKSKIFCIGHNKTGTTSLEKVLRIQGYYMGDQLKAETLIESYFNRRFDDIIRFCESAEAFQDVPFSLPFLYICLDQVFPDSKFILTIRDSDSQWYNSITKFHKKITNSTNSTPTFEDLKDFDYNSRGWLLNFVKKTYGTDNSSLYNENLLKSFYNNHNQQVIEYFRYKNNLLVINISEPNSYSKLARFLNFPEKKGSFPWLNKTSKDD